MFHVFHELLPSDPGRAGSSEYLDLDFSPKRYTSTPADAANLFAASSVVSLLSAQNSGIVQV
jgi:hypothetical protein